MEFDWLETPVNLSELNPREIEESFEDPFSLRLLPDYAEDRGEARYFCLGRSIDGKAILSIFWTDGKIYRVLCARPMHTEEEQFFDRKNAEVYT